MAEYDLVVVGIGGMGAAISASAVGRGQRVLGLEKFKLFHSNGSTHGETRVTRNAYFEHPNYVPLLMRSNQLWQDLEKKTGQKIYYPGGIYYFTPELSALRRGILESAQQYRLAVEIDPLRQSFYQEKGLLSLFEAEAGFLDLDRGQRAWVEEGKNRGLKVAEEEELIDWYPEREFIRVITRSRQVLTRKLVLSAGAWIPSLAKIRIPIVLKRKMLYWFKSPFGELENPVFFHETPGGIFYGFPTINGEIKIAEHSGGTLIQKPEEMKDLNSPEDDRKMLEFVRAYIPQISGSFLRKESCMYELTPDEHFLLAEHPDFRNVLLVGGMSGHGYKFAPIIAEIAADWSLSGGIPDRARFLGWRFDR